MAGGPFARVFRLAAGRSTVARDVEVEIAFHLEEMAHLLVAEGWSPEAARDEARRRFGDVPAVRRRLRRLDEETRRRTRRMQWIDELRQDLTYALRGLRRGPGFAAVVVFTLGLALGANATMFGVVDRLLLSPPPHVVQPDQVRWITVARWRALGAIPRGGYPACTEAAGCLTNPSTIISYPVFLDLRDRTTSFSQVAAVTGRDVSYGLREAARPMRVAAVSAQFFPLLGTSPARGRYFAEPENRASAPVAVVSHPFWRTVLGGRDDVVGTTIHLDSHPFQVVGVAPPGFTGASYDPVDGWVPFSAVTSHFGYSQDRLIDRRRYHLEALVRLRPGVSPQIALEDARRAYQGGHEGFADYLARAIPAFRPLTGNRHDNVTQGRIATWLFGVSAVLLLIACANVGGLMLSRGVEREGEIAVRLSLGVSRGRLVRQLLTESLVLAGLGAAAGLGLVLWLSDPIRRVLLPDTAWEVSPVNERVLVLTLLGTASVAILAGLVPLLRATRIDLARSLHAASRSFAGRSRRLQQGLLLVQTTMCTALLIGAGLFLRSLERAGKLDLGIDPSEVVVARPEVRSLGLSDQEQHLLWKEAEQRIRRVPGVNAAGLSTGSPFVADEVSSEAIRVPGLDSIPRLAGGGPFHYRVSPEALEAMGVRLLQGRLFDDRDRAGSPAVAVVTEHMARTLWPGQPALGKCFITNPDEATACREVVGVIANLHIWRLEEDPFMLYFTLLDQVEGAPPPDNLIVRGAGDPGALIEPVRRELLALRPTLPYIPITPMEDAVATRARSWRLGASMFTLFGLMSLVIAAMGLYGVLSFLVARRRAELGVRAALGATPGGLLALVLRSGVGSAVLGAGLGTLIAIAASSRLAPLLFRTSPQDPAVLLATAATVVTVGLLASLVPGLRATRVDPMAALRAE